MVHYEQGLFARIFQNCFRIRKDTIIFFSVSENPFAEMDSHAKANQISA